MSVPNTQLPRVQSAPARHEDSISAHWDLYGAAAAGASTRGALPAAEIEIGTGTGARQTPPAFIAQLACLLLEFEFDFELARRANAIKAHTMPERSSLGPRFPECVFRLRSSRKLAGPVCGV